MFFLVYSCLCPSCSVCFLKLIALSVCKPNVIPVCWTSTSTYWNYLIYFGTQWMWSLNSFVYWLAAQVASVIVSKYTLTHCFASASILTARITLWSLWHCKHLTKKPRSINHEAFFNVFYFLSWGVVSSLRPLHTTV